MARAGSTSRRVSPKRNTLVFPNALRLATSSPVVDRRWLWRAGPRQRGAKPRPAQIGVEHGTGPKALDRLAEVGVKLPQGWVKRQDHAKHGIVAELPDGEDPSVVITWLIVASTLLRTVVEPGEDWIALVHEPDA